MDSTTATPALPKGFSESKIVDSGVEGGIYWMTYTAPLWGAINGYVHVPDDHPWFGLDYDSVDVEVHGGLTFGGASGWFGFDTLHSGDVWPGTPVYGAPSDWDIHWTAAKVADEAKSLARAAAEAAA